jgi:hypothetical protein
MADKARLVLDAESGQRQGKMRSWYQIEKQRPPHDATHAEEGKKDKTARQY